MADGGADPFGMVPGNVWADDFAQAGGLTAEDLFAQRAAQQDAFSREWLQMQEAAQQRAMAARAQAQQNEFALAEDRFLDWPTYQTEVAAKTPPHMAYDEYVGASLPWQLQLMGYSPEEIQYEVQQFTQMVPRPNPDYGFIGNLWETLKGGFESGTRASKAAGNLAAGDTDALARLLQEQAAGEGRVDSLQRFYEAIGGEAGARSPWESVKAFGSATADNPAGSLNFLVEQLSQSYPVLGAALGGLVAGTAAAGPVGGIVGGAAGTFGGSTTLEVGAGILERIQKEAASRGINVNDANAVATMLQDPTVYGTLRDAAVAKGLTVGAADAAVSLVSLGIGKAAATAARAGRAGRATALAGAGLGVETAGGAGGEALSQLAAGDELDWREIVGEAYGELLPGAANLGMGAMLGQRPAETPPAPPAPTESDLNEDQLLATPFTPAGLLPSPSQVAIPMPDLSQQLQAAEDAVASIPTNPLFDTLDRVSPGWRENATETLSDPTRTELDGTDPDAIEGFLLDAGVPTRVPTVQRVIIELSRLDPVNQQRLIADTIDELIGKDAMYAEPTSLGLLALSKALPGRAQQVIEDATVPAANETLLETIRRTTGQTTADERRAVRQQWAEHFVALMEQQRQLAQVTPARQAEADAAWLRVQEATRIESMMDAPERRPVDQAALDAAQAQLERAIAALPARTPTSREKLQKLRERATLLLEETVDGYNRSIGQRPDAGRGGDRADGGGGSGPGGGGAVAVTGGGRTSPASAITPLQYRALRDVGGRYDVADYSIGAKRIADELGIEPGAVVSTVAEALARVAFEQPLTSGGAFIPVAEAPFAQPLNPSQGLRYHAQAPDLYRNHPYANTAAAEQAARARRQLEAKRQAGTARAVRRGLRPGELIPTADIVTGERGPIEADAGVAEPAFQPGGSLYPSLPQEGPEQGRRRGLRARRTPGPGTRDVGAQPDNPQGDQGVPGLVRGTQYPMQERINTRNLSDEPVTYVPRNPLRDARRAAATPRQASPLVRLIERQLETDAKKRVEGLTGKEKRAHEKALKKWKKQQAEALAAAQEEFDAEAKASKPKGLSKRALRKEAELTSEAMYEEVYGRDYDSDLADLLNLPGEQSYDARKNTPFVVGSRVRRVGLPASHPAAKRTGKVVAVESGQDNRGRPMPGVRVLWDDEAGGVVNPFTGKRESARPTFFGLSEVQSLDAQGFMGRGLTDAQVEAMSGTPDQVLRYLESTMQSPLARIVAARIRQLGLKLPPIQWGSIPSTTAPNGVPVLGRYRTQLRTERLGTVGRLLGMRHQILIDPQHADLETILHEFIHAATLRLLEEPETLAHVQARQQLEALLEFVRETSPEVATQYGATDVKEFVAEALSNPEFQAALAKIPLPYTPRVSVLDAIKRIIMRMFGVTNKDNVLSEVFGLGMSLMGQKQVRIEDVADAQAPRAAPSTAILGIKDGQRAFIAYKAKNSDTYTLYPVTAQFPAGVKGAGTKGLTRERVEQKIKDGGAQVLVPAADTRIAQGTPKNSATRLVGYSSDGTLRAVAFEQKDGTWTYYESDADVRTDPDAKVVKGQSKDAVQRFITAQGLGPTPPTPTAVQPAASTPTAIGYDSASSWQVHFADSERQLMQIDKAQREAGVPWSMRIGVASTLRNSRFARAFKQAKEQYVEPARKAGKQLSKRFGKSQEEIETVLQNLHIVERMPNKIRQMERGDMSPTKLAAETKKAQDKADAAQQALAAARASNPPFVDAVQQELSPKIKQMSDHTIDLMASYGLITREVAEEIKRAYDYYVPLQFGDKTSVGKPATGQNVQADKSFARMVEQLERVIARGEQNRIRVMLKNIADQSGLYQLKDANKTPVVLVGASPKIKYDAATNSINESLDNHVFDEDSLTVYEAGVPIRITINDPLLLEALHPYKGEERVNALSALVGVLARVNHIIAIGKTSLNPAFPLFNFMRDIMTSHINLPPGVSRVELMKQQMNPANYLAVFYNVGRDILGKDAVGSYKEAEEAGSFISHRQFLGGTDEVASALETMFRPSAKAYGKWARGKVFDVLSVLAQVSESMPRLATYKAARASGMDKIMAAHAAKTASVNFEKRGLKNLSGFWIFGNAKMQGLMALMDTMERAGMGKAAAGVAGLIALGALAAAVGYEESEKDKDGVSKYTKIPDYRKDTMVLFKEGWYGVPIPQEIAPFYVLGNAIMESVLGGTTPSKAASRIFTSFMNNYVPSNIPQQDVTGHKANAWEFAFRSVMPSQSLPIIDLVTNRNTFGSEVISGLETMQKQGIPKHLMGSPTENQLAVNAAKTLHDTTGIDMAPQHLRLLNNYFNPTAEGYAFWRDLLSDREPKYQGEIVNPIARRFTGAATSFYDQNQFDELLASAQRAQYMAKEKGIASLTPEEQALARSASMLQRVESDTRNLFKGNKLLTPERRKLLNDRKQEMILDGIRRYNDLRDRLVARK